MILSKKFGFGFNVLLSYRFIVHARNNAFYEQYLHTYVMFEYQILSHKTRFLASRIDYTT